MEKIRDIIRVLSMNIGDNKDVQIGKNVAMSIIVCMSAGIMLIMNIIRHSTLMMIASLVLVVGFIITGIIAGIFKNSKISSFIMILILTSVFTLFLVSGGNEGFAVLWILLIPLFSISLFGLKAGICMNVYFLFLILTTFYTPLNCYLVDLYTDNFLKRFPVLFLADLVTAEFLSLSIEYFYRVTRIQLYTDEMTGAYNRKYFMEKLNDKDVLKDDLCICAIDVNGLKEVNDALGHLAGDELICSVPIVAKKAFGDDVMISRIGGDEFSIITYGNYESVIEKVNSM